MTTNHRETSFHAGQELVRFTRVMTRERMRWYCDGLETNAKHDDGKFHIGTPNIHNDDDFAAAQGLPGIIADGMISTNWISGALFSQFGLDYLERGSLRTKYIRPIFEDEAVNVVITVREVVEQGDEREIRMDLWCEVGDAKCTVGDSVVLLPASA